MNRVGEQHRPEVQRLVLTGYSFDHATHLVLKVASAASARRLVSELLNARLITFGDSTRETTTEGTVNLGFTSHGLKAIGLPRPYLEQIESKARTFHQGAPVNAAQRLGDSGDSAVERWDSMFAAGDADVLISIHGPTKDAVDALLGRLRALPGAEQAFRSWTDGQIEAEHLDAQRTVHFGFRDNISQPAIVEDDPDPQRLRHRPGELLLGHANDSDVNRWADRLTPPDAAAFFLNGSFGVLRLIEQKEHEFRQYLREQAAALQARFPFVTEDYLKAKMCGRWSHGARVLPGVTRLPDAPTEAELQAPFDFSDDKDGHGCPFGAHIRRTNPRGDAVAPLKMRPLFRRGMPYGKAFTEETAKADRGLVGLFFCASIEDQFEQMMTEWVEKNPMGPANRGRSKDPLVGHHEDAKSVFHIPLEADQLGKAPTAFEKNTLGIGLNGFQSFVRTRGTLYALYLSRFALTEIARIAHADVDAEEPAHEKPLGSEPPHQDPGTERRARGIVSGPRSRESRGAAHRADADTARAPSALADTAPADRFCDIVMEGGVTSGIIYAGAVTELAQHYRFKSIGGSSIGAFAAALTAAAEFARRNGSMQGFQLMDGLPARLAEEDEQGQTRLRRMFIPQEPTRRLFAIFVAALGEKTAVSRVVHALREALRQYRRSINAAAAVAAVLVLAGPLLSTLIAEWARPLAAVGLLSWLAALLVSMAAAGCVALLVALARDIGSGLVGNDFGLCRGWSVGGGLASPDLAGFLYLSIQAAAGLKPDDAPLTFKNLWDAPGGPGEALGRAEKNERSIDLQVYVANLAHGRPYRFPADADEPDTRPSADGTARPIFKSRTDRLFFRVKDLAPFFPEPVMRHLIAFSRPYAPESPSDPSTADPEYRELPREHLPVVVAARLAMSFPLLISAVPLWAIDYEPPRGQRQLSPCWMSDGGLCSNFPIHLFDSVQPRWPTFGISLGARSPYHPQQAVWLPDRHFEGRADTWHRGIAERDQPAERRHGAGARLAAFLVGVWKATWRWNDMTMMRMPGVRDRVVRVLLRKGEGGVNIAMTGKQIKALAAEYGPLAGRAFVKKFAEPGSPGWNEHRWVRFNRLLVALRDQIEGLGFAADLDHHTVPMDRQIQAATKQAPLRGHTGDADPLNPSEIPLTAAEARQLRRSLRILKALEPSFEKAGNEEPYVAEPRPRLRVRPPT